MYVSWGHKKSWWQHFYIGLGQPVGWLPSICHSTGALGSIIGPLMDVLTDRTQ